MCISPTACARCRFGAAATWDAPPTYAFMLGLGADVRAEAAAAEAWAATHVETSATAFCGACGQICWVSRRADAQAALLEHAVLLRGLRALRRQAAVGTDATADAAADDVRPRLSAALPPACEGASAAL